MKKKSAIVKLTLIGIALVIGIILSVCSFPTPFGFHEYRSFAGAINEEKLGLDLKGGIYAVYEAESKDSGNFASQLSGTQKRLQDLLNSKGYPEAVVVTENNDRLRVEVPSVNNPDRIFDLIGRPADVQFVLNAGTDNEDIVLTGDNIRSAEGYYSPTEGAPVVDLTLDDVGAERFAAATSEHIGENMAIYIVTDGQRDAQPISAPTIQSAIAGGRAQITMTGADEQAAIDLADRIMSGTFDVTLHLRECSTISPTLGEKALFYGLIAAAVGLALVVAFLAWRYRLFGVVATIALAIYTVLMLFFLAVFPWVQLTLPGIAGIILSLGMAVDGNIIIYERIRDEYRDGKSILASVHAGFKKATVAIFDSNITTVIAAIILIVLGTGSISGFGMTLLIGIILSMFTSLLVTRGLCKYFVALNSTNPKLYNLKRGQGVPAEDVTEEVAEEESKDVASGDGSAPEAEGAKA